MPTLLLIVSLLSSGSIWTAVSSVHESASTYALKQSDSQEAGFFEGRIAELKGKIAEKPDDPDLHFELSKLYEEDVDRYYDEALAGFKRAVDRGLKNTAYNISNKRVIKTNNKGTAAWKLGRYKEALVFFQSARKLDKRNHNTCENIAICYSSMKEHDEALKYIKKARDLVPKEIEMYQDYMAIALRREEHLLALLVCEKIEYLDNNYNDHYYGKALAYHALGEYAKAIESIEKAPQFVQEHEKGISLKSECEQLLNQGIE